MVNIVQSKDSEFKSHQLHIFQWHVIIILTKPEFASKVREKLSPKLILSKNMVPSTHYQTYWKYNFSKYTCNTWPEYLLKDFNILTIVSSCIKRTSIVTNRTHCDIFHVTYFFDVTMICWFTKSWESNYESYHTHHGKYCKRSFIRFWKWTVSNLDGPDISLRNRNLYIMSWKRNKVQLLHQNKTVLYQPVIFCTNSYISPSIRVISPDTIRLRYFWRIFGYFQRQSGRRGAGNPWEIFYWNSDLLFEVFPVHNRLIEFVHGLIPILLKRSYFQLFF